MTRITSVPTIRAARSLWGPKVMTTSKDHLRCARCGDLLDRGDRCPRCLASKAGDLPAPRVFPARFIHGMSYPFLALALLRAGPVRRFILFPAVINAVLFLLIFIAAIVAYPYLYDQFITSEESFWQGLLQWFLFLVYFAAMLVVFFFTFAVVGTVVAGPFLEPISRRVETEILGTTTEGRGRGALGETIYSLSQAAGMILVGIGSLLIILPLSCIPLVGAPLALVIASWVVATEYLDASFARKRYPLGEKVRFVLANKASTMGFGMAIQALLFIPILNLFVLPLGAVAATMLYLDTGGKGRGPVTGAEAPKAGPAAS